MDLYFLEVVAKLKTQPKTAKRIRPALQYYSNRVEHISGDLFVVDSPNVSRGLEAQKHTYVQSQMHQIKYPHQNLPCNALSSEEHMTVLTYIYEANVTGWKSMATSWNLGNNCFIRCDTFLKLRLSSLFLNTTHGPEATMNSEKTILPMVAYILTPFDLKSADPSSKKRMAGCWRHSNYLRCGTGAVAMNLFTTLHYNDEDIIFFTEV